MELMDRIGIMGISGSLKAKASDRAITGCKYCAGDGADWDKTRNEFVCKPCRKRLKG